MRNYVQRGNTIPLPAPYAVLSGGGFLVGSIFAVANFTAAQGESVEGDVEGVFDLLAEGAGSGQAFTEGQPVYWDDTNRRCTKTTTNNTKIGVAVAPKLTADTAVRVRLNGVF